MQAQHSRQMNQRVAGEEVTKASNVETERNVALRAAAERDASASAPPAPAAPVTPKQK